MLQQKPLFNRQN